MTADREDGHRSSVTTVPYDADCELVGAGGEKIGEIAPGRNLEPREFRFDAPWPPRRGVFSLVCHKAGYPRTRIPLTLERQSNERSANIAGNMLLFSPIGGALISALEEGMGATMRYRPRHYVILASKEFESAEMRDDFFNQEADRIKDVAASISERIHASCTRGEEACGRGAKSVEDRRDQILSALEQAHAQHRGE